ncbi:CsbD family protein [Snodgrassella sp. CFCC 13594]|uniref:CsbD family protein n=1 Tax=Snodgrassella sp. CFCC 13594 TaxID=1775559 RepID=UPI00082E1BBB|nr:CsbD family protein [Snodgrassella sp. CFCC 13594]
MNWEQISGQWQQLQGKAREQWGKLTDDDLHVIAGKRDQLLGKVKERYGYTKEQAEEAVREWESKHGLK